MRLGLRKRVVWQPTGPRVPRTPSNVTDGQLETRDPFGSCVHDDASVCLLFACVSVAVVCLFPDIRLASPVLVEWKAIMLWLPVGSSLLGGQGGAWEREAGWVGSTSSSSSSSLLPLHPRRLLLLLILSAAPLPLLPLLCNLIHLVMAQDQYPFSLALGRPLECARLKQGRCWPAGAPMGRQPDTHAPVSAARRRTQLSRL